MKALIYSLAAFTLLALVGGCGGGSPATPPPPLTGKLYVTNGSLNSVLRFPAGANGNVGPQATFAFPGRAPVVLALDAVHDRLAAVSFGDNSIVVTDNASTTFTPVRTISGTATTLSMVGPTAIDSSNDLIYIANSNITGRHVLVFGPASSVSGNVSPLRSFDPANPPDEMVLDSANNRLFFAFGLSIDVYDNASTLSGAVTPNRTITGPLTQITNTGPMALDNAGHLIMATKSSPSTVLVFANAGTANGNVAPANVAVSPVTFPSQVAVATNGDLYVVDGASVVNVFSNITTASGILTPVRVITGPDTGLNPPQIPLAVPPLIFGIAFDSTR